MKVLTSVIPLTLALIPQVAQAFCGTYVGDGSSTLQNRTSQIVLVRQGDQTTLTLSSDYSGDAASFGLLIPVPPALVAEDISLVDPEWIQEIETYTNPRLVSYTCEDFGGWEAPEQSAALGVSMPGAVMLSAMACSDYNISGKGGWADPMASESTVDVEAEVAVGEYDVVLLTAEESADLLRWLNLNGYVIDQAAKDLLQVYIDAGSAFLAAKISLERVSLEEELRLTPLRLRYTSEAVSLPLRLGTLNSTGVQDLVLHVISDLSEGAFGISNYEQVRVRDECMERALEEGDFAPFYDELLNETLVAGRYGTASWLMEYSWSVSPWGPHCDPCPPESLEIPVPEATLAGLGFEWDGDSWSGGLPSFAISRLRMRYAPEEIDEDLMLYSMGYADNTQIRYIRYDEVLEGDLEVCGEGKITDPERTCQYGMKPSIWTGITPALPSRCGALEGGRPAWVLVALGALALRRRRMNHTS
ncbi:DUF2330 domain-containing protein [Myxococcota bacterium]|nr:DUF2330 domain-containing protein [Myxococcota bacterium]